MTKAPKRFGAFVVFGRGLLVAKGVQNHLPFVLADPRLGSAETGAFAGLRRKETRRFDIVGLAVRRRRSGAMKAMAERAALRAGRLRTQLPGSRIYNRTKQQPGAGGGGFQSECE